MEYVLQKEKLEKERKIIEAAGIAAANEIISGSLTSQYLDWYWIENLKNHNNVVYLLSGEGGLPIFKDVDNQPIQRIENPSKASGLPAPTPIIPTK